MTHAAVDVVVVGGGIIGRSVASAAARRGMCVLVVEPGGRTFGTSSSNAGHLVPSHRVPFAAPGMVRAGLHSLVTRDGAFAVSPRVMWRISPWLWRFARNSTAANVARGVPVLASLLDTTVSEVHRLRDEGAALDFSDGGVVQVCTTGATFSSMRHEAQEWSRWGVRTQEWSSDELLAAEPSLRSGVAGAVVLADDGRFDPAALLAAVTDEGLRRGVRTLDARVRRVEPTDDRAALVHTSAGTVRAGQVVVAAGAWTPSLCAPLGVRLPIVAARGDSVTLAPGVGAMPTRAMLLVDQRLAVNPLAAGLRITGGFGLTSTADRAVHDRRSRRLVQRAAVVLDLPSDAQPARRWTGLRPATPDGLPVIGRLPHAPAVLVAAGHGMLGSTTGPGTGEMVAAMLSGAPVGIDVSPLSPARFGAGNKRKGSAG
ncbi:MAG: FAD-dependent oxidoreductase [Actinomycetota bacterium]|nr:FAD-dependent oxidoreductase [Actinomycetota bacterium]